MSLKYNTKYYKDLTKDIIKRTGLTAKNLFKMISVSLTKCRLKTIVLHCNNLNQSESGRRKILANHIALSLRENESKSPSS